MRAFSPLLTEALYSLGVNALDNGLALKPQLGCVCLQLHALSQACTDHPQNIWNSFACDMNETVIFDAARRIVDLGSKDLGYKYVVMDDCWSAGRNSSGYLVHDKEFPNGIAHVAEKIHELGLKVGIYPSAGSMTCARYEGSLGYEQKDADVWASWGVNLPPSKQPALRLMLTIARSTTSNTTTATMKAKEEPPNCHLTVTTP